MEEGTSLPCDATSALLEANPIAISGEGFPGEICIDQDYYQNWGFAYRN